MCEGIASELEGIDLGDKRLNDRSVRLIEALSARPDASVNAACDGWNDTIAAYRFFGNAQVHSDEILKPHVEATKRRMREHPLVLIVQDTTELDFSNHPAKDARCLNKEERRGFYEHTHLAVTPDKLCLGLVGSEQFDREPQSLGKTTERKTLPIEQKESFRWLAGYRLACQLTRECADTWIISVADREADIYDIFVEAQHHETPADFIIRAKEDRCTPQRDPAGGPATYIKVEDEVSRSPVRHQRIIDLCQTPKRQARKAEVEIRAIAVEVKPPQARNKLPSVTYNVVQVREVNGPGDDTEISWLLITTLSIDSLEDIQRVIDGYLARWIVEIYFRVLKTGCRVEEMQLETTHRLRNCLALYKIIAWRTLYLTYMNRTAPTMPCTAVFADYEWKPVWKIVAQKPLPKKPPTLSEFIALLTRLGGYNNRRNEAPPGPQPIWVGIRRMTDFAIAWLSFGPKTEILVYK